MAQPSGLTCRQAQKLMHMLLDRRWSRPVPPRLGDHFEECQRCRSFLALFDYQPVSLPSGPASGFSDRIISSLQRQKSRKHQLVHPLFFASAAAILFALALGLYLSLPESNSGKLATPSPKIVPDFMPALLTAKQEIEQVPERLQGLRPVSFDLLAALPEFELQVPSDPLNGTIPSVKVLGTTLQAAVEPIETPAKEAYQKVKMIMHDPNVKKWLDSVTNGSM